MFLTNYSARALKIKKNSFFLYIKYSVLFVFLLIIIITFNLSSNKKNNLLPEEDFFKEEYEKNRNFLKIENAKLIGGSKNALPYTITAKTAIKNNGDKDLMLLYSVEADITLKNGSWLLLSTDSAFYKISEKLLSAREKVQLFYDNGTTLETTNVNYKINKGLVEGDNKVRMFGGWGTIESGSFSINLENQKLRFHNSPVLRIDN